MFRTKAKLYLRPTVDRFNNWLYDLTNVPTTIHDMAKHIDMAPPKSAILISGNNLNSSIMKNLDGKLQYIDKEGKETWLIRRQSTCPELFNGRYYAGGVNLLVRILDSWWTLLVKDNTKSYVTCPGGTAIMEDFKNSDNSDVHFNIAVREFREETTNIIPEIEEIDITLVDKPIEKICQFNFSSQFFNLRDIPDTYEMYGLCFHLQHYKADSKAKSNFVKFIDYLYNNSKQINNDCMVCPSTNSEIEFVYLQRLYEDSIVSDNIIMDSSVYKLHNHPVSALHILASYQNLYRHGHILTDPSSFTSINKTSKNINKTTNVFTNSKLLPANLTGFQTY